MARSGYADEIAADLFAEEQTRLSAQIDAMRQATDEETAEEQRSVDDAERFDEIAAYLADMDADALWEAATESERRTPPRTGHLEVPKVLSRQVAATRQRQRRRGEPRLNYPPTWRGG